MSAKWKARFADRSANYPVINSLIRLLLFSFWFRVAVIACVSLVILVSVSALKIWRVVPSGFPIVLRISAIDWAQSRSLARASEKSLAAGKTGDALISLQAAIANNPGNLALIRRFLSISNAGDDRDDDPMRAARVKMALWLNRLSPRPARDVDMVAETLEKLGMEQELVALFKSSWPDLTDNMAAHYLKALFNLGAIERFGDDWRTLNGDTRFKADPEMSLYRAAFAAIDRPAEAVARMGGTGLQLERSAPGEKQRTVLRLRLVVFERNGLHEAYRESLSQLQKIHADRIADHVRGWRMLKRLAGSQHSMRGLEQEAVTEAQQFLMEPKTSAEVVMLCGAWMDLGLRPRAEEMLHKATTKYAASEELWSLYIRILSLKGAWIDLRNKAFQMRMDRDHGQRVEGLSHFAEGRAHLAEKRPDLAATAFEKAAQAGIGVISVAADSARELTTLGYPAQALAILSKHESLGAMIESFCDTWIVAAHEARRGASLLKATEAALRLQPNDWKARNNRAAAFCSVRTNAAQAVALTMPLMNSHGKVPAVLLNHALALCLNQRWNEAVGVFEAIPQPALSPSDKSACHFGWTEALIHLGQVDRARTIRDGVNPGLLFSEQLLELKAMDKALSK